MKLLNSREGGASDEEPNNLLDMLRRSHNMEKKNEIEIIWGTLSYKGSLANLTPVMEAVFSKLPPTPLNVMTPEQIIAEEEALGVYA